MRCLLLLAVVFVSLAYYAYEPFPENAEEPLIQMLSFVPAKIVKDICRIGVTIGYTTAFNCTRAAISLATPQDPEDQDLQVSDVLFDDINVRLYKPRDASHDVSRPLPGLIFIHGGGWVIMTKELYDPLTRRLSRDVNTVLVSIEYRKAPEHIYPAAFDDCLKAVKYFMRNAKMFNVDPKRIGIAGDSAGGNLAMAVSLKLSESGHEQALKLQGLIYPALQMVDFNTPSYLSYQGHPFLLTKSNIVEFWMSYAFGSFADAAAFLQNKHSTTELQRIVDRSYFPFKDQNSEDVPSTSDMVLHNRVKHLLTDKYLAPLMCSDKDLKSLPKMYLVTCEYDPLRDEGFVLAGRMKKLQLSIQHKHWEGVSHGFINNVALSVQEKAVSHFIEFLKSAL